MSIYSRLLFTKGLRTLSKEIEKGKNKYKNITNNNRLILLLIIIILANTNIQILLEKRRLVNGLTRLWDE